MPLEHPSSEKNTPGKTRVQRLVSSTVKYAMRVLDEIVNGKSIKMFETMIVDIIATGRVYEYDINATYYEKLLSLIDIQDDIELITNAGTLYKVKDYPHIVFTRRELEQIGERYTQLKFPELSEEFA